MLLKVVFIVTTGTVFLQDSVQGETILWFIIIEPTLLPLEDAAATEVEEVREEEVCSYLCQGGGGCTVHYTGPPRAGPTSGSCFSQAFGGSCSGTPAECQDCNEVCYVSLLSLLVLLVGQWSGQVWSVIMLSGC